MHQADMQQTVEEILALNKGVLALDWSPSTIAKQFEKVGLTSTPDLNRDYRQMLITASGLNELVSGIILHDQTIHQNLDSGDTFPDTLNKMGIVVGVRADEGSEKYADTDQDLTKGLNGLEERLEKYAGLGIRFTKWRAGFKITDLYPSKEFIVESVEGLVTFAKASHKFNLVPFVEPDVEMKGKHTTTRCAEITEDVLELLFRRLSEEGIDLSKVILKTNMVLPGIESGVVAEPLEVANATLRVLRKAVPKEVGGIVFLSGGQSYDDSVSHLDKIEDLATDDPWKISFSYARSLQVDALAEWAGKRENIDSAQKTLLFRLQKVVKARMGEL